MKLIDELNHVVITTEQYKAILDVLPNAEMDGIITDNSILFSKDAIVKIHETPYFYATVVRKIHYLHPISNLHEYIEVDHQFIDRKNGARPVYGSFGNILPIIMTSMSRKKSHMFIIYLF